MRMLASFLFVALLMGCSERVQISLKEGYKVIRVYGDAHSIITPDGRELIMPNVVLAKDNARYVVGLRKPAEPMTELPPGVEDQPFGYFIYDKSAASLQMGLSQEEFEGALKESGIDIGLD